MNTINFYILLTGFTVGLSANASGPVPVPEVKVALLGDTGVTSDFKKVLKLVAAEKADVVMINGDLGYGESADTWKKQVTENLDINRHLVIGSLGNHDIGFFKTSKYISAFGRFRNSVNNLAKKCSGGVRLAKGADTLAVDEICTFENVSIVASAIGQVHTPKYLEGRLDQKLKTTPSDNWKLVGYHFTLENMNPGIKSDENTHRFFDIIRKYGAIGAQAHTHSVMASCPIASQFVRGEPIRCHADFGANLEERFVEPGVAVYLDSSLGGQDVRSRKRCKSAAESDCGHLVDIIAKDGYTRRDGVEKTDFYIPAGAMFLLFNVGGDSSRALAYYKSIDGKEVFRFNLSKN